MSVFEEVSGITGFQAVVPAVEDATAFVDEPNGIRALWCEQGIARRSRRVVLEDAYGSGLGGRKQRKQAQKKYQDGGPKSLNHLRFSFIRNACFHFNISRSTFRLTVLCPESRKTTLTKFHAPNHRPLRSFGPSYRQKAGTKAIPPNSPGPLDPPTCPAKFLVQRRRVLLRG